MMVYFDETSAGKGALRVVPGSHRSPRHAQVVRQTQSPAFKRREDHGAEGIEAAIPFESHRGDAIFFHHCLFHAAFHKFAGRSYGAINNGRSPVG